MQLGKALIGAVIGSAVGIGLILAIYYAIALDHTALAILVAVCAGLGVRALVTTTAHVSYLRGVLTCVIAILAFAASKFLIADLAARGAFAKPMKPVAARAADDATDEKGVGDSGPAQPVETPQQVVAQPGNGIGGAPRGPGAFSTWDFVLLSVAALVAYELGRGSGAPKVTQPIVAPPDAS
jgi:hypothetical protein